MFKKRTLLLGAAVAAFGAIMAGAALANPNAPASTGTSGSVGVTAPSAAAQFNNYAASIPATTTLVHFADVQAKNTSGVYANERTVSVVETTAAVQTAGTCGAILTSVVDGSPVVLTGAFANVGEYKVSLAPTGTNNTCTIGNAVVTVTVEAF